MSQPASEITCPKCGKTASGEFCTHCGVPLSDGTCPKCNSSMSPGASFCHVCGASASGAVTAKSRGNGTFPLPWAVALGSVVIVVIVLAVRFTSPAQPAQPTVASQGSALSGAPDISTMTPRQQADRLFDMIMAAAEAGDTGRVAFHTDMAIQAYSMLGDLDGDARYHVGLIHVVRGETEEALAEADAMEATVPGHLLAHLLRGAAARASGDAASLQDTYRKFLGDYEREIAVARPEYEMHRNSIESFLTEARFAGASGS